MRLKRYLEAEIRKLDSEIDSKLFLKNTILFKDEEFREFLQNMGRRQAYYDVLNKLDKNKEFD